MSKKLTVELLAETLDDEFEADNWDWEYIRSDIFNYVYTLQANASLEELVEEGVSEETAEDILALRKVLERVIKSLKRKGILKV